MAPLLVRNQPHPSVRPRRELVAVARAEAARELGVHPLLLGPPLRRLAVLALPPLLPSGCAHAVVALRDLLKMCLPSGLAARLDALGLRLLGSVGHTPDPFASSGQCACARLRKWRTQRTNFNPTPPPGRKRRARRAPRVLADLWPSYTRPGRASGFSCLL